MMGHNLWKLQKNWTQFMETDCTLTTLDNFYKNKNSKKDVMTVTIIVKPTVLSLKLGKNVSYLINLPLL